MRIDRRDDANPFSTRHVRPGAFRYIFPPGESLTGLVERLEQFDWWGAIVGEHGSGKSTLVAELIKTARDAGRRIIAISLHDRERRLPVNLAAEAVVGPPVLVVIDGYEQLGRWSRWRARRHCQRRGWGLIVTSHHSTNLPTIYCTSTSIELAQRIAAELASAADASIAPADVAAAFSARAGNLRDVLFDLYDLHEQRRREGRANAKAR